MQVTPLAITRVNWEGFNSAIKELTGDSASRPLDKAGLSINGLLSLPLVMGMDDSIDLGVLDSESRLDHIFCSFLVSINIGFDRQINNQTDLTVYNSGRIARGDDFESIYILSGTLTAWRESIFRVLKSGKPSPLKTVMTTIRNVFVYDLKSPSLFEGRYKTS
jgi:hypothetical protein